MAIKKKAIILGLDGMRPDMLREARAPRIKGLGDGYDSPEYRMSIEVINSQVGEVLDAVKSRPAEEDWMVWVISDHGGRGRDHGRPSPEEMTIALVLSSARLKGRGRLNAPGGPVTPDRG